MGFLGWIILGGLAGWLASTFVRPKRGQGCVVNIVVGIVGAFIGGFLVGRDVREFNLPSLVVAFIGAVVFLLVLNALEGSSRRR